MEAPPNPLPSAAAAAAPDDDGDDARVLGEGHHDSLEKMSIPLADG